MNPICFIDTETTGLHPGRRAWDIGIIARDADGHDTDHQWFVEADDLDLGGADPFSLSIGKFYDRHPQYQLGREADYAEVEEEADVLRMVEAITRGSHLVGAVVSFDADVLGRRMRAHGICPSWHYHLIDVEALTVGYIAGHAEGRDDWSIADIAAEKAKVAPPWKSDALTTALGIPPVAEDERHTALGDARWARSIYDRVMRS